MPLTTKQLYTRARKIKLLLMDVDGVLTDGRFFFIPGAGGRLVETKAFHSRDGLGFRIAHQAGLKTGFITGRQSPIIEHRAKELGVHYLKQHAREKLEPYQEVLREARLEDEEVCYVGDDIVDLPLLTRVGLAVGVADSHQVLRRYVHYMTKHPGGFGAVRETIELILSAQGKWQAALDHYLR
jgi:3-deoxy-D-manno-octulosonate 8-phosphate phosphatase (KDO 8-P phosphatase)